MAEATMSFLSRLFEFRREKSSESRLTVPRSGRHQSSDERDERPIDIDLENIEYIPLPPSPNQWDLRDQRDQYREHPQIRKLLEASWQKKHAKVLRLSERLSTEMLNGETGKFVAKAYFAEIQSRLKSNKLTAAASLQQEMLRRVPNHCSDVDQRRFNKIVERLNKARIDHEFVKVDAPSPESMPQFEIIGASPWRLGAVTKLAKGEQPEPSLKLLSVVSDGIVYSCKKDANFKEKSLHLLKHDVFGKLVSEQAISHDIYRIGINPSRNQCAIMDRDGILYIYDASLNLTAQVNLQNDFRVVEHFRTTDTSYWGDFRTQIRSIDVSLDGQHYLYSLADEAWCCSASGASVWGARVPLNEGWTRAIGKSERTALRQEVIDSLNVLGLQLPINAKEIKSRYRQLAFQFHPDRNPEKTESTIKMQRLNEAFRVITGVDPDTLELDYQESEITYFRKEGPDLVIDSGGIRIEVNLPGGQAQDWIYAASFKTIGQGAFLATYSGKIIEVDSNGRPLKVFDVGTVPEQIVDTENFLYIRTATRVYVIDNLGTLIALVDIFDKGTFFATQKGFALLESKRLQWFSPDGEKVGEIIARNPIRRILETSEGLVVESRQHQAVIEGLTIH